MSFAFAGLFLVGNNVFGGDPSVIIDGTDYEGGGIVCAQDPRVGGTCWTCDGSIGPCVWTGYMSDTCCQYV
ncbi:MAG: hypothetical protein ACOC2F_00990 [Bacteroidota bacterium]